MSEQYIPILIAAVATFGLVISIWLIILGSYYMRKANDAKRQNERLGLTDPSAENDRMLRLWHNGEQATTLVPQSRSRRSLKARMRDQYDAAGLSHVMNTLLLGVFGGAAALGLLVALITGSIIIAVCATIAVLMAFHMYIKKRSLSQLMLFDQQLIDALELAARSLRAGHPLSGAFHLIAEEIPQPVGGVFNEICQQEALGVGHEDAIRRVAETSHSDDMRLFGTSIAIQLRSGGNLADMMERLADVIRERMRLSRRVRVLTAQTQLSKNILLALPFFMFLALFVINPDYAQVLYATSTGHILMAAAGGGLILGAYVMNRMVQLKY